MSPGAGATATELQLLPTPTSVCPALLPIAAAAVSSVTAATQPHLVQQQRLEYGDGSH
jgi:hypothetical protein